MGPCRSPATLGGSPVTLYRRGRVPRINPVFVDDAAELTRRAMEASATMVVNSAGGETATVQQLSQRIAAILDVEPVFVAGRDPAVGDMVASLSRSARALGFTPRVSLERGLRRTLETLS